MKGELRAYIGLTLRFLTVVIIVGFVGDLIRGEEPAWPVQKRVGPFHFHSDASLEDIVELGDDMMRLKQELSQRLGLECSVEKIHIVLLRSEAEYQRYIKHYFPTLPSRRALFIKDRGPGIVFAYRHSEFLIDLRHECTHALLQHEVPKIPLWLDEGLAEYFEGLNENGSRHTTHVPIAMWQTKLGHVPPLEELEQCLSPHQMDGRKYSDAWAWVHFLLERNDKGLLQNYLHDVAQCGDAAGALSTRVRRQNPTARDDFLNHFQSMPKIEPTTDTVRVASASLPTGGQLNARQESQLNSSRPRELGGEKETAAEIRR